MKNKTSFPTDTASQFNIDQWEIRSTDAKLWSSTKKYLDTEVLYQTTSDFPGKFVLSILPLSGIPACIWRSRRRRSYAFYTLLQTYTR